MDTPQIKDDKAELIKTLNIISKFLDLIAKNHKLNIKPEYQVELIEAIFATSPTLDDGLKEQILNMIYCSNL